MAASTAGRKNSPGQPENGVLPVANLQGSSKKAPPMKAAGPRLKVVVRRLAPGLTETEFLAHIGDQWRVGQGKVDWFMYKPGKDSKE